MKKKGIGMALVLHPSGNKGAGDPSNAAIQLKPDGTLALLVGAVDLGQGSTTILRQFAADVMEVPIENVFASNFADDFAPLSLGSFASRVTLIDPARGRECGQGPEEKDQASTLPNCWKRTRMTWSIPRARYSSKAPRRDRR